MGGGGGTCHSKTAVSVAAPDAGRPGSRNVERRQSSYRSQKSSAEGVPSTPGRSGSVRITNYNDTDETASRGSSSRRASSNAASASAESTSRGSADVGRARSVTGGGGKPPKPVIASTRKPPLAGGERKGLPPVGYHSAHGTKSKKLDSTSGEKSIGWFGKKGGGTPGMAIDKEDADSVSTKGSSNVRMGSFTRRKSTSIGESSKMMNGFGHGKKDDMMTSIQNRRHERCDDPLWKSLFLSSKKYIVDPEDVHSFMDERVSSTIDLLSPSEVTVVQRRTREVMRSIVSSTPSGSSATMATTMGSFGNAMMGRLTGGNVVGDDIKSRTVYQKENLMDENVVRKIFAGGERFLQYGYDYDIPMSARNEYHAKQQGQLREAFMQELKNGNRVGSWHATEATADWSALNDFPPRYSIPTSLTLPPSLNTSQHHSTMSLKIRQNSKNKHHQVGWGSSRNQQRQTSPTTDPIGAAYVLLIHLAESRWDVAAVVARLSAARAGLNMDVNHNNQEEHQTPPRNKSGDNNVKGGDKPISHRDRKEEVNVPAPPPPSMSQDQYGEETPAPPPLPGGISFSSLCFLIALALRGTRLQRLQLLFYLLLPPKVLKTVLSSHPAGGVPSWLLEVDCQSVISYASLAHYYYYGTFFLPHGNDGGDDVRSSGKQTQGRGQDVLAGDVTTPLPVNGIKANPLSHTQQKKQLVVGAQCVFDTIAILLSRSSDRDGDEPEVVPVTSPTSVPEASSKEMAGHKSPPRKNSNHGVPPVRTARSDMGEYLSNLREGSMLSLWDGPDFGLAVDRFWRSLPTSYFADDGNGSTNGDEGEKLWTIDEFADWATEALDDDALDIIMHRLFGTGILPSPSVERDLVLKRWLDWQNSGDIRFWSSEESTVGSVGYLAQSVRKFFHVSDVSAVHQDDLGSTTTSSRAWGGIGGFDGRGGLGHGVMFCIDKKWWEKWEGYSGWEWKNTDSDGPRPRIRRRPHELSSEQLVDRTSESVIAGTFGSYELMKSDLRKDEDYVLVPPGVWDMLYMLYGGGPPLPRMVLPLSSDDTNDLDDSSRHPSDEDGVHSVEVVVNLPPSSLPLKLPKALNVCTHPWVLHCHLCDPLQPYRRGDAGPISIRVMVTPDQPLWRFFAELVARLPVHHPKAGDGSGRGRARLWKRIDPPSAKDVSSGACRYGPWTLLCKNRFADFPLGEGDPESEEVKNDFKDDWQAYADHGTIESVGLNDGARIMFEYAVLGKGGVFTWPREAAAKAGRMRRVAEEDTAFRRMLRGVDADGNVVRDAPSLVGKIVDAMDSTGRWYQVEIVQVDNSSPSTDDDGVNGKKVVEERENVAREDTDSSAAVPGKNKLVRVDFSEVGGHEEWIDVSSDRLAVAGRFTLDSVKNLDAGPSATETGDGSSAVSTDAKSRLTVAAKKTNRDSASNEATGTDQNGSSSVCPFPGYGACGLTNLGNTCYMNSALQCISYMPLLRSYLVSGQYRTRGDLNKDNPLGTGGKILEEFADLLRVMWSGKYAVRAPTRFRAQLGKVRTQYSGADQQDAQELLNDILDILHEDSNRVKKKPYVEALEDHWVKGNGLPRVGLEAWRRFLRRNRSVVADVAMGQVLNRVTCPKCNYSSRSFDPFNMLSIPFPTIAEVIFRCTVVRRGTAKNCPSTLKKSRRRVHNDSRSSEGDKDFLPAPPSDKLIVEQYVIAMSRLADVGDLKLRLQNVSGIPHDRLRLCRADDIVVNAEAEEANPVRSYVKVTALRDNEGPCVQLAKHSSSEDLAKPAIAQTQIIAFESTLNPRPPPSLDNNVHSTVDPEASSNDEEESTADEDEDDLSETRGRSSSQHRALQYLRRYGDQQECRVYDTDPTPISKAMSRSLWPRYSSDFKLGLRVDAIDHRDHWFPGSVVEIIENAKEKTNDEDGGQENGDSPHAETKVRIHFDNFSSKWDETYTIEQFKCGQVRPLYSHATPRTKPTEFLVHHRCRSRSTKGNVLFGQAFFLQCQNEWSTARAGAHILAQAARFLQPLVYEEKDVDKRKDLAEATVSFEKMNSPKVDAKTIEALEEACAVIAHFIDLLIESDRQYVEAALSMSSSDAPTSDEQHGNGTGTRKNPVFNTSYMSAVLSKKVSALLPRLPFEVRVCTADSPLGGHHGGVSEEVMFPFSLVRTIGNYMNARHAVVLHWREISHRSQADSNLTSNPILYIRPTIGVHRQSLSLLNDVNFGSLDSSKQGKPPKRKPSAYHGGMHLGVCLTEFCKEQQLHATDCWRCPKCKEVREGMQSMSLWRLPDILTFHIKRFNCSARWREKITTKVNFPLTGLDMSEWCDKDSPALHGPEDSYVYDLIGVVNHYGGMTGGHYVATCKATACGSDGSEEVAYNFNGAGVNAFDTGEEEVQAGWRLGRSKDKEAATAHSRAAQSAAKSIAESSEPLWLQFDDDLVEPIPPRNVVSEMAYVLFYRRRRISPSNIAKYNTLD